MTNKVKHVVCVPLNSTAQRFFFIPFLEYRWKGGAVNEICLAEGTTVYVQLKEIRTKVDEATLDYSTLIDNVQGWSTDSTLLITSNLLMFVPEAVTWHQVQMTILTAHEVSGGSTLAAALIGELISCAQELFDEHDDETSVETFPFRTGSENAWAFPYSVDLTSRDENGQQTEEPSFHTYVLSELFAEHVVPTMNERWTTCLFDFILDVAEKIENESTDIEKEKTDFIDCLENLGDETVKEALGEMYKAITEGFELVFGVDPSVGYICGLRGAETMPGYCCLDAPYELNECQWGNQVINR